MTWTAERFLAFGLDPARIFTAQGCTADPWQAAVLHSRHPRLLVIDKAARVRDDLSKSVRPMLAVSGGRLACLSTPFGRRGFVHAPSTDPAVNAPPRRNPWLDLRNQALWTRIG